MATNGAMKSPISQSNDFRYEAEETQSRILGLLSSLDDEHGVENARQLNSLKSKMDSLMNGYFEQHSDLESEMNDIYQNLRDGLISQSQLEMMLRADNERSGVIVRVANALRKQLEQMFASMGKVIASAETGNPIDMSDIDILKSGMNNVLVSVESISRVAVTPVHNLSGAVDSIRQSFDSPNFTSNTKAPSSFGFYPANNRSTSNSNVGGSQLQREDIGQAPSSPTSSANSTNSRQRDTSSRPLGGRPLKAQGGFVDSPGGLQSMDGQFSGQSPVAGNRRAAGDIQLSPTPTISKKENGTQTDPMAISSSNDPDDSVRRTVQKGGRSKGSAVIASSGALLVTDASSATGNKSASNSQGSIVKSSFKMSDNDSSMPSSGLIMSDVTDTFEVAQGIVDKPTRAITKDFSLSNLSVEDKPTKSKVRGPSDGHSSAAGGIMEVRVSARKNSADVAKSAELIEKETKLVAREKELQAKEQALLEKSKRIAEKEKKLKAAAKASGASGGGPAGNRKKTAQDMNDDDVSLASADTDGSEMLSMAIETVRNSYSSYDNVPNAGSSHSNIGDEMERKIDGSYVLAGGPFTSIKDYYERTGPSRDIPKRSSQSQRQSKKSRLGAGLFPLELNAEQFKAYGVLPGTNIPYLPIVDLNAIPPPQFMQYMATMNELVNKLFGSEGNSSAPPDRSNPTSVSALSGAPPSDSVMHAAMMNFYAYIAGLQSKEEANQLFTASSATQIPALGSTQKYQLAEQSLIEELSLNSDLRKVLDVSRINPPPFTPQLKAINPDIIIIEPARKRDQGTMTTELSHRPINIPGAAGQPKDGTSSGAAAPVFGVLLSGSIEGTMTDADPLAGNGSATAPNASLNLHSYYNEASVDVTSDRPEYRSGIAKIPQASTMGDPTQWFTEPSLLPPMHTFDTTSEDPHARRELPVVFEQDGLVARTYRHIPARNFKNELMRAENPLLLLHDEYADALPDHAKARLLRGATHEKHFKSVQMIERVFSGFVPIIERLNDSSNAALINLEKCETMVNSLAILSDHGEVSSKAFKLVLMEMARILGEAELSKLLIDIQLVEYRSFFEKANSIDMSIIPTLRKSSKEFERVFDLFTCVQGKSVDIGNRIDVIQERSFRQNLEIFKHNESLMSRGPIQQNRGGQRATSAGTGNEVDQMGISANYDEFYQLQVMLTDLQKELKRTKQENELLNVELLDALHSNDLTPGVLLFFSALHDPSTVSVLQQLSFQLAQLKGFADGSDHVDFGTLRKRIQVSIAGIPTVDRFLNKYNSLYKKWVTVRLGMFRNRNLTGGNADAYNCCPLCFSDMRYVSAYEGPHLERLGIEQEQQFQEQKKKSFSGSKKNKGVNSTVAMLPTLRTSPAETILTIGAVKLSKSTSQLKSLPDLHR